MRRDMARTVVLAFLSTLALQAAAFAEELKSPTQPKLPPGASAGAISKLISVKDCVALKGSVVENVGGGCASGLQCNPHEEGQPGGHAVCITSLD